MPQVSQQVAIVTGAGSGIGRAIAHELAARGHQVMVADIDGAHAREVATQIKAAGGDATDIVIDIRHDAQRMVDETVARYGRVVVR